MSNIEEDFKFEEHNLTDIVINYLDELVHDYLWVDLDGEIDYRICDDAAKSILEGAKDLVDITK